MAKALEILVLAVSLLICPTLGGCWSSREIETLAVIQAAGIDIVENSVRLALQISQPIALAAGGGLGGGGGGATTFGRKAVWNVDAEGTDVREAARRIELKSPRSLFWGHNQLIVIGESAASRGVAPVLDFFLRNPDSRIISWMVVSKTDAKSIIGSDPPFTSIPARSIILPLTRGLFPSVRLERFMELLRTEGVDPFAALVEVVSPEEAGQNRLKEERSREVRFLGVAAFRDDKLAGFLNEDETIGFALARGERFRKAMVTIPSPKGQGLVTVSVNRHRKLIMPEIDGGKVEFKVKITAEGDVVEVSDPTLDLSRPDEVKLVEGSLCSRVDELVLMAIEKQKSLGADVVGLGRELRRHNPETWLKLKDRWHLLLRDIEVRTECKVKIRRTGLITAPKR